MFFFSGLDPAGPSFYDVEPNMRIDKTSGEFVDIIHTNACFITGVSTRTLRRINPKNREKSGALKLEKNKYHLLSNETYFNNSCKHTGSALTRLSTPKGLIYRRTSCLIAELQRISRFHWSYWFLSKRRRNSSWMWDRWRSRY